MAGERRTVLQGSMLKFPAGSGLPGTVYIVGGLAAVAGVFCIVLSFFVGAGSIQLAVGCGASGIYRRFGYYCGTGSFDHRGCLLPAGRTAAAEGETGRGNVKASSGGKQRGNSSSCLTTTSGVPSVALRGRNAN